VAPGEAGILVAPLTAVNRFLGYAGDQVQSEKKLLRNVLKVGDVYFNTEDLLLLDRRGFLYFHDCIGDTFRWKGESVSTTEVSDVLDLLDFIQEANVYGVTIPGLWTPAVSQQQLLRRESRAGMAAVVLKQDQQLDGKRLYQHLVKSLPCVCLAVVPEDTGRSHVAASGSAGRTFPLSPSPRLPPELPGRDRNLQATEDQAGAGGFQPRPGWGPALLPPRSSGGLCSPRGLAVS
ncbi:unnamed protein product, partial [Tetraodon nigroviridis]